MLTLEKTAKRSKNIGVTQCAGLAVSRCGKDMENGITNSNDLQNSLIYALSHDVRSPLKFVASSASRLQQMIAAERFDLAQTLAHQIEGSVEAMCSMLENLSVCLRHRYLGEVEIEPELRVRKLIFDKISVFRELMESNGNRCIVLVPEDATVPSNAQLLAIILHNLIDNANKFCQNGIIRVLYQKSKYQSSLIISDQGVGIPLVNRQWLVSSLSSQHGESQKQSVPGLGLIIVKELTRLLGIDIRISVSSGTSIALTFRNQFR